MLSSSEYLRAQLDRPHAPQGFVGTFPAEDVDALKAMAERCGYLFAWRALDDGKHVSVHCDRKPI